MLTVRARVETEHSRRYLKQLCRHAEAMSRHHEQGQRSIHDRFRGRLDGPRGDGLTTPTHPATSEDMELRVEWSDSRGTLTFVPGGRCSVSADATGLSLQVDALSAPVVQRIQDVVTRDLERFSQRNPLEVSWGPLTPSEEQPIDAERDGVEDIDGERSSIPWALAAPARRDHRRIIAVTATVVLSAMLVALHLGLASATLAGSAWLGVTTEVVVALVLIKVILVVTGGFRLHRRRDRRTHRTPLRADPDDRSA